MQYSELLNIMNFRGLPRSSCRCLTGFILHLLLGTLMYLLIFVTQRSNYIYVELQNCTQKFQLRKCSRTHIVPQLCLPPRAPELQAPGHQLDTSQVKISYSSNGLLIFSFHECLCYNQTLVFSLAVASFSEVQGLDKN